MAENATIIAASLSDEELKKSITALVDIVKTQTGEMAKSFDDAIGKMIASLDKFNSVTNSTKNGSNERSTAQQSEQKAVSETVGTYDQLVQAMQRAVNQSQKRYDVSELQQMRMRQHELLSEINKLENIKLTKSIEEYQRLQEKIEAAKSRIQQLQELMSKFRTGEQRSEAQNEIERLRVQVKLLESDMKKVQPDGNATQRLQSMRLEYEQINRRIAAMGQALIEAENTEKAIAQANNTKTKAASAYTEEIRKQAQAIRESKEWQEKGRYTFADGTTIYNREDSTKNQMALEQQILEIKEKQISATKEEEKANQKVTEAVGKRVAFEQNVHDMTYRSRQILASGGGDGGAASVFQSYDNLRQSIAAVLHIQQNEVQMVDASEASYNKMAASLKQLKQAYDSLSRIDRESQQGKDLIVQIQVLEREIQKLKAQASRPISLIDAKALNENTLDDIAYKMRMLSSYRSGLDVNKQRDEIDQVNKEYDRLKKKMDEVLNKNQSMIASNTALGRSWNYMKNRLAFYFSVGASTAFIKNLIEVRSQYEMNERALGILVDSAERGTKIFNELSQMALVSPYTLIELSAAAKQLTAYDIAARDVVDTTRRLADMASAVGVPIDRLTYALGQIKAYGYLNSRDARMFANAGIPLVKQLSDYYTELEGKLVSTADVYDRIKKKAVDYNEVMQVINKMTDEGGKFFDFQAKMADTLKVRLANLTLAWNNMLNDIGAETQGVLTWTIGALRDLFLHWRDLDNAIKSAATIIGLRTAFMLLAYAVTNSGHALGLWSKQMALSSVFGGKLAGVIKSIALSLKALLANPLTYWAALATAVGYVGVQLYNASENTKRLNEELRTNAKESSENISKFIKLNTETRKLSQAGSLGKNDASKAWEAIRNEIETASDASGEILSQLISIDNMNERVRKGFDYLENIQKAKEALQNLKEKEIEVSQDLAFGLGGEGLATDVKQWVDYAKRISEIRSNSSAFSLEAQNNAIKTYGRVSEEADYEITKIAKQISGFLTENDITDPFQISEIVGTVKSKIKEETPALQGEIANMFDVRLDEILAEKFGVGVDKSSALWSIFMEDVKAKSSSAFNDVDERIYEGNTKLSEAQQEAIDKGLERFKQSMPLYYDELVKLVNDSSKLKIQIGITFDVPQRSDFQREFDNKVGLSLKDVYQKYRPKEGDQLPEWVDSMWDALEKLKEEREKYARDNSKYSEEQLKAIDDEIGEREHLLKLWKQPLEKKTSSGSKKDILGEALSDEVQIISDMQKRFKEYRQMGVSSMEAVTLATNEYGKSLAATNAKLAAFGIKGLSGKQLATMPMQDVRDFYAEQLKGATSSEKGVEALEKAIANLNVEITKLDYKRITDGLNNELDKLKDEYELGVQLDANPELGSVFMDLFDIDPNQLPSTIEEYSEKVMDALNQSFAAQGKNFKLPTMNLTPDDMRAFKEMASGEMGAISEEDYKAIEKVYNEIRSLRKKDAEETLQQTQELQYNLADINGKIAIETEKLERLKQKYENETDENRRKLLALQIQDQENTIQELKEDALQLMPFYMNLFDGISDKSRSTMKRLISDARKVMKSATKDYDEKGNVVYHLTQTDNDGNVISQSTVSAKKYQETMRKINQEAEKIESSWEKIARLTDGSEENGENFWEAINVAAEEAEKVADGVKEIGNIAEALGADEETVETINDVAASIDGVAQASKGVAQAASGDIVGGVVNIISGTWNAVSTWFDNKNKRINREVQKSETAVKQLELAYKSLEREVQKSMGAAEIGARRAAVENKKLQLAELERQLQLEQSRKKKDQDKDKMLELEGSIQDLKNEIGDLTEDIVNNLLGSDVKSAAEEFVDTWVDAWKAGETTLDAIAEKMDDVIFNIVKKAAASKIVGAILQPFYDMVDGMTTLQSEGGVALTTNELRQLAEEAGQDAILINEALGAFFGNLSSLGILNRDSGTTPELSALQAGIKGITEETAGALEAYMNGVLQQVYLHSQLLTEIRDTLTGTDGDVSLATNAQMLLQLQQSYQVQMAIQTILEGWSSPSGLAVRVEMV